MSRPRVVIVGGGITGLSAAYYVQETAREAGLDLELLLLEQDDRLGGKVLSEERQGYRLEGGPDSFVIDRPAVIELAGRLGIAQDLQPTSAQHSGSYVWSRGRLHRLPEGLLLMVPSRFTPFLTSSLISWPGKLRMALDILIPPNRNRADESLEQFVTRRLGREALDRIAEPLVAGIHAAEPSSMSLRATFPRFIAMEQNYGSLIRAALAARKKAPPPRPAGAPRRTFFMTFAGGLGQLPNTLAQHLPPESLQTGHRVSSLEAEGEGYRLTVEGLGTIHADAVILALPSAATAKLLGPVDGEMAALLSAIPLSSTVTVSLAYRRSDLPSPLEGFGFVVPSVEHRRILGVTYTSNKWEGRVPGEEVVLLRAFIGGAANQDLASGDEEEIIRAVREELAAMLGIRAEPLLTVVYRWPRSMHQYTLGHLQRVEAIEGRLPRHPGLFLAGGAYRGVGLPACVASGKEAAEKAVAFLRVPAARD